MAATMTLDATPLIRALRETPSKFEFFTDSYGPRLRHDPSRHDFVFKRGLFRNSAGIAEQTQCGCNTAVRIASGSQFSRRQQRELWNAYAFWWSSWWEPRREFEDGEEGRRINKQFAAHFNLPPRPAPTVTLKPLGARPAGALAPAE